MTCCVVVYDIADAKRLRKVAARMEAYGIRIQKSVFGCALSDSAKARMIQEMEGLLDAKADQVRIYDASRQSIRNALILGVPTARLPEQVVFL